MKPIRFSGHAQQQLVRRGAKKAEVEEAIRHASWENAELGRLSCRMNFPFDQVWNGKFYSTKQVRPVFVDEPEEIVVITVYTYYF